MSGIMTEKAFRKAIKEIPGADGWWHSSGCESFVALGKQLTEHGFTYDEAVDFLSSAYGSVAGEFGG